MKISSLTKKLFTFVLTGSLFFTAQLAKSQDTAPQTTKKASAESMLAFIPEKVASINGETVVSREDVFNILKPQLEQYLQMDGAPELPKEQLEQIAYSLSEKLLEFELLKKTALEQGAKLDTEAAKEILDEQKANQGEENFNNLLKMQGLTYDQLVNKIAESMIIEKLHEEKMAEFNKANPVDEKKLVEYYEENKQMFTMPEQLSAAHLLLKFDSDAPSAEEKENLKKRILEIKKELDNGADFAALAKQHSACPSKEQGGDLGNFQPGNMVPEFEAALLELDENEISGAVETQFGFHLIKAGKRTAASVVDFEQVKEHIATQIQNEANNELFKEFLENLHKINNAKLFLGGKI